MDQAAIHFVTDFADQAVILPLTGAVALVLAVQRRWRRLLAWLVAVSFALGAVLLLKVVCYACGWLLPALDADRLAVRSPSGHVVSAVVVYGGLAVLLARRAKLALALGLGLALAGGIGMTRLALDAHSPAEVAIAGAIGLLATAGFTLAESHDRTKLRRPPLLAAALVVVLAFHGLHLGAEIVIKNHGAELLRQWIQACQPQ